MFIDARTIPNDEIVQADVCIIGGGAAGIALAREFSGQPFRVAVLESGDLKPADDTQRLAVGESVGLRYYPLEAARLRYFGGTTNHWGGTCRPFDDIDFEARDWIPHSGWPIGKAEVEPYYERARQVCHLASPDWDTDAWAQRDRFPPLPVAGRAASRVAQVLPVAERSFGRRYRSEVDSAQNVTVYLNANVAEIETNEEATAATGVRVACLSGNHFAVRAKVVVLAAGGIENARQLLLSNSRQRAGLGNRHDLVGRFFMEHPRFEAGIIVPADRRLEFGFYQAHPVGAARIKGYLGLDQTTIRRERLVDIQLNMIPVYSQAYRESHQLPEVSSLKFLVQEARRRELPDDFATHVSNVVGDLLTGADHFLPVAPLPLPRPLDLRKVMQSDPAAKEHLLPEMLGDIAFAANEEIFSNTPVDHIRLSTRIDPVPNPDSRITLGAERDALGQPRARLDWQLSPLDKYSVRRTLEIIGAEIGRAGLGRLQMKIEGDDTTWPRDTRGGWHHMGTTRMSDDPRSGVVDRNCRVHGIDNLFVAGSSVFPTAGSGTPTMMLVALALRLADHIKGLMQ
jgi:choline dehydrogenase-like flavoprotein